MVVVKAQGFIDPESDRSVLGSIVCATSAPKLWPRRRVWRRDRPAGLGSVAGRVATAICCAGCVASDLSALRTCV